MPRRIAAVASPTNRVEFDNAIADNTEAIRLNPQYVRAYCSRGTAYGLKGDFSSAVADCTEAIRLDPQCARRTTAGVSPTTKKVKRARRKQTLRKPNDSGISHESQKNGRRCGEVGGRRNASLGAGRHTNAGRDTLGGALTRNQCLGVRVRLLRSAAVGCLWHRGGRRIWGGGVRQEGLGLGAGIVALFFNPIIPVHLMGETWGFIDVGAALLLLVSIITVDLRPPSPRPHDRDSSAGTREG